MRYVLLAIITTLFLNPSLARTIEVHPVSDTQKISHRKTQTATKNVLAHALSRAQKNFLIVTGEIDDDDLPGSDELDLHVFYSRPRVNNKQIISNDNEELSDYVITRLAVARARAMAVYREKFVQNRLT